KVAKEFPGTTYAIVDAVVDAPNVVSLTFAQEQGSFIVGAAAALKSHTGRVGFLGGVETGLIRQFEAGFTAGARYVDPRTQVEVKYLSQPPDFTGFADPARGREVGLAVYDTVKAFVGSSLHPGPVALDVRSGGIGFATSGGAVDDIKDRLQSFETKIANGEITVPRIP